MCMYMYRYMHIRQVTRKKSKSGIVVKHNKSRDYLKITLNLHVYI